LHNKFRGLSISDFEGVYGKENPVIIEVKRMLRKISEKGFFLELKN